MKIKFYAVMAVMGMMIGAVQADTVTKSGAGDQTGVEVTAYNSDLALIKEVRNIRLDQGSGNLWFEDVSKQIQPETVSVRSLNRPEALRILEQNYEYDLISEARLLDKYVGHELKLVDWSEDGKSRTAEATLVSNHDKPIYRIGEEIYIDYPGYKILPSLPDNLVSKPSLVWNYANTFAGEHQVEVSYLTSGVHWKADYVMRLSDGGAAGLEGWITLENRSGAAYRDASLKLVAGNVNRATPPPQPMYMKERMVQMAAMDSSFAEAAFFEYHIYDLNRKTTIGDNQNKQIRLFETDGIKVERVYKAESAAQPYQIIGPAAEQTIPVTVYVKFDNKKENRLGMPLPGGIVRVYQSDKAGSRQFAGEDRIEHTPKNETVELKLGQAFDLVVKSKQTDFRRLSDTLTESAYEITVKNQKETPAVIRVYQTMTDAWKITDTSEKYVKENAYSARYDVSLAPSEEKTIRYKVRLGK